ADQHNRGGAGSTKREPPPRMRVGPELRGEPPLTMPPNAAHPTQPPVPMPAPPPSPVEVWGGPIRPWSSNGTFAGDGVPGDPCPVPCGPVFAPGGPVGCPDGPICCPADAGCCPELGCPAPCCTLPRFWVNAEYLLWTMKDPHVPTLVTSTILSPAQQFAILSANGAFRPGALGQPGTVPVFGGGSLDENWFS